MLLNQFNMEIESFILSNLMKDVQLNEAGCEEHGDLFVIIHFHTRRAFQNYHPKLLAFLKQDITREYGTLIEGSFIVNYALISGNERTLSEYNSITSEMELYKRQYIQSMPNFTKEIIEYLDEECMGTFFLNDYEYGENLIQLEIQVDSIEDYLKHEDMFYSFIGRLTSNYTFVRIALSIGVFLVNGSSMNELSYSKAINKMVYGIE